MMPRNVHDALTAASPQPDRTPLGRSATLSAGPRAAGRALRRRIGIFARAEDGVMAPYVLVFFFLMLVIGGISVDVMRFETRRVAVQNTLDRATLAAASLNQRLNPTAVVNDYFAKANLLSELQSVDVVQTVNGRTVTAEARALTNNYFMSILDVPRLEGRVDGQAEQRITNVEIILVLDVSGSMAGSKLSALKVAANEFVDTVKANDGENRITIGVVPYNAQVNAGPLLRNKFALTHDNGNSDFNCVEFPASLYGQAGISRTTAIPMMAAADVVSSTYTSNSNYYAALNSSSYTTPVLSPTTSWCDPNARARITLPTANSATVKSAINNLYASGNTSIAIGMKWGTALVDPKARTIFSELITAGQMSSAVSGRPYAYDDTEAMKVIVLMTDGEHVASTRVPDAYKTGASRIYKSRGDGYLSIYHPGRNGSSKYWVPHLGSWQSSPYQRNSSTGWYEMDWSEVWDTARVTWVAYQLYSRSGQYSYNTAMNMLRTTYASAGAMDNYLEADCETARSNNVLIYTIAFDAPSAGKTVMRNCASTPTTKYYMEAATPEKIRTAFALIASNLSRLRLTQ